MGFDKSDIRPVMQPAKKETRVNIGMVLAIVTFFILGGLAIVWIRSEQGF